jgi:phosphatidylserine/phosphatidylglycerophosphate/cardiolipin synthase-like enzyme
MGSRPTSLTFHRTAFVAAFCLLVPACARAPVPSRSSGPKHLEPGSSLTLVESVPVETTLQHDDVPDAHEVWLEMVNAATQSLDIAQFYVNNAPGKRLAPIIEAIERAADRGVRVRFLADEFFAAKYPETLDRLSARKGIALRRYAVGPLMGGVLHAKYFVVDRREIYLGSQNFDWVSLEHIQEMGVRVRSQSVARALLDVFEADWQLADSASAPLRKRARDWPVQLASGEAVTLVASPKKWLPDEKSWDLPVLEQLIDDARGQVDVQVLTYKTESKRGGSFHVLDDALRSAAKRKVKVRLLVSDWSTKPGAEGHLALWDLSRAGVEVRVLTVPPWSGGPIDYGRVAHAKYMVVDGALAWVGTSNWEGDYFLHSRNVGLVVQSPSFADLLGRVFEDGWASAYSAPIGPPPGPEREAPED